MKLLRNFSLDVKKGTWILQHHLRQLEMYFFLIWFHRLFPLGYVFMHIISLMLQL